MAAVSSRALEEMLMPPSKADAAPPKHPDGHTTGGSLLELDKDLSLATSKTAFPEAATSNLFLETLETKLRGNESPGS